MVDNQNGAYEKLSPKDHTSHKKWSFYAFGGLLICGLLFFIINTYTSPVQVLEYARKSVIKAEVVTTHEARIIPTARSTESLYIPSTTIKTITENLPENIASCIPFYDLIQQHVKSKTGWIQEPKTPLSPIGAYAYPDYSVVTMESGGWFGLKVYCRYFDKDWVELKSPVESVVFPEFAVHCCRHPRATYMGISERKDEEINFTVPVLDRTTDHPKYTLSLCLAPMYGNESKWLLLAELIEHYKLQGVEHFYLYVKDIDNYSRKLIDDYVKTGEVEAVYFTEVQDRAGREWQLVGVKDCVQRSRHHSRYAIFADLDERILALGNSTLAEYVLKTMAENPNIGMIQFRTTWILRTSKPPNTYEGEQTIRVHLPTLVFHNTSAIAPPGHTAKCVLDTRRVLLMWVHAVTLFFPGYDGIGAPPEKAIIRHYRDQIADNWGTTWIRQVEKFGEFTMTDYPEELMQRLYANVKKRLSRVYRRV